MSLNLTFLDASGNPIRTPYLIENTWVTIRVVSYETYTVVPGIYLSASTWGLAVDYPADYPPETDYQDLVGFGTRSDSGAAANGGLKLKLPQNDGSILETYITRTKGSTYSNRIAFKDILAGGYVEIQVMLEVPPIGEARRFFVNLNVEE